MPIKNYSLTHCCWYCYCCRCCCCRCCRRRRFSQVLHVWCTTLYWSCTCM